MYNNFETVEIDKFGNFVPKKPPINLMFFLGAGASVEAGIPDTHQLVWGGKPVKEKRVQGFLHSSQGLRRKTVEKILQVLEEKVGKKREEVDIEFLLRVISRLNQRERDELRAFFEDGRFVLEGFYDTNRLEGDLKKYLRKTSLARRDRLTYFNPFESFARDFRPLNIFTVNYDNCLELFFHTRGISYRDGFSPFWDPEEFNIDTDIRLYKLHGSVTWYETDEKRYYESHELPKEHDIVLTTEEKAKTLMLYPGSFEYAEPYSKAQSEFVGSLKSADCVFVVGYSFRDEPIMKMFHEAGSKNRKLTIFVIDPDAIKICSERLRGFEKKSSLFGRVVCLPYEFGRFFPKLHKYLKSFTEARQLEENAISAVGRGEKAELKPCIKKYIECEHVAKVVQICPDIRNLQLSLDELVDLVLNIHLSSSTPYICNQEEWIETVYQRVSKEVSPSIENGEVLIKIGNDKDFDKLQQVMEDLVNLANEKVGLGEKYRREVNKVVSCLIKLKEYFSWCHHSISLEKYLKTRKKYEHEIKNLKILKRKLVKTGFKEGRFEAEKLIQEIESMYLNDILNDLKR